MDNTCTIGLPPSIQPQFYKAVTLNNVDALKVLLADERINPAANNNFAIRRASQNGHVAVVKVLLADKRVDPTAHDNYAIRWASLNSHLEIVKLLLADNRIDTAQLLSRHIDNKLLVNIILDESYTTTTEVEEYKKLQLQGFL